MAVFACKNITITFPKNSVGEVLDTLQHVQAVELVEHQKNADLPADIVAQEVEVMSQLEVANKAYDALAQYVDKKKPLAFLTDDRVTIGSNEFKEAVSKKAELVALAKDVTIHHDEELRLKDEQEHVEKTIHTVSPLRDVDVKIFGDFSYMAFVPFFVHESRHDVVVSDIRKRFPEAEVETIDKMNDEYVYVAAVAIEDRDTLITFIMDNATIINIDSSIAGSFHDVYNQSTERLEEIKKRQAVIDNYMQEKVAEMKSIAVLKDILHSEIQIIFAWHSVQRQSDDTYMIQGFVDPTRVEEVSKALDGIQETTISVTDDVKASKVIMKNNWFVKPFEIVTKMMGVPVGNGIDPTPILAAFFVFMYGLALSEAGYGLVCAIITGVLLLAVRRMKPGPKSLFTIIFYASVSTLVVGSIFGSWFGVTPSDIDTANPDQYLPHTQFLIEIGVWPLMQKLQLLNPLQQILTLMIAMGILGIVHLMIGLLIGVRQEMKRGKFVNGLLTSGLWLGFLTLAILNVLNLQGLLGESLKAVPYLAYAMGAYVVIMIPLMGREAGSLPGKFAKGAFDLFFGAIGYVSDILSYTRLVALGLATGIIASVVNLMAGLAGSGLVAKGGVALVIGYVLMVVIFIGGHIFNIALNVLGSYITVGRLHFVEFFSKFFESGGQELQPFKKSEEYISIVPSKNA